MLSPTSPAPVPAIPATRPRRRAHTIATSFAVVAVFAGSTVASGLDHVVLPGETLGGIAPSYGSTVSAIAEANELADPNRIFAGQILTIPEGADGSSPPATYTVLAGDTLSVIAAGHATTVSALVEANGLSNPDFVREGATLSIPGLAPAAAPTSTDDEDANPRTHLVVAGETLAVIAGQYAVTVTAMVDANAIVNPNFVREGSVLTVPEPAPVAATPTPVADTTAPPDEGAP